MRDLAIKLGNCPYCKSDDLHETYDENNIDYGCIRCNECYAQGPTVCCIGGSGYLNAYKAWNKAADCLEEQQMVIDGLVGTLKDIRDTANKYKNSLQQGNVENDFAIIRRDVERALQHKTNDNSTKETSNG